MGVKIYIAPYLQQYTADTPVIEAEGQRIGECLGHLVEKFPDVKRALFDQEGKLFPHVAIFKNLSDVYPDDLAKPVTDGDELYVAYIIAGG
ncbi:MAG: MoaD/ThiS family protein [Chloroflexi bacterium]|nr:MoaD/ThiS family protein [Chloroflexota bacterium]